MTRVTLGGFVANDATRDYINEVLDSGRLSYGPFSRTFEQQWAALHDSKYAVLSNSGTSALVVALQAAKEYYGWADGDQVIVPALTFVATVNAVLHNRLIPILVDVEVDYYNIDVNEIEAAITPLTKAILPVHLFGQPANMPAIMEIAKHHELVVIEDSCETVLSTIDDKPVGSWGDMGCFSTYVAHHIVTGVGGITTTSNPILERLLRSLVNHGIDLDQLPTGDKYDPTFLSRVFSFSRIGHSFRITELEAAIGVAQLQGIFNNIYARQRYAELLSKMLYDCRGEMQLPKVRPNATHSYMMYPIVMFHQPKEYIKGYLVEHDIEVRDMVPLTNQPCYRNLFDERDYPVAEWINRCGFYIGCHAGLTEAEVVYAAETIQTFIKG